MDIMKEIVEQVSIEFRTFGGGRKCEYNPISIALQDTPASFAAGVDVRDVVERSINLYNEIMETGGME